MASLASSPIFAKAAGLSYVNPDDPGISRVGGRRGIEYRGPDGSPIEDEATLERIRKLAIPPAWTEVWICPNPVGHIQAVGRDQRGRKQYRYHADWREVRDAAKFDRVAAFGRALPKLRRRIERDLRRPGLPREKVLAAVVRLLEITLIRVGNPEYARANKSFGLTTMRDRHVKVRGAEAIFEFRGKSGKPHRTGFRDRRLARVVAACQDVPGQRLFQYLDGEGVRHAVGSADVNAYLREAMGEDFSAKDFRTWAGTLAAARALLLTEPAETEAQAKARVATCVKAVAGLLGNTPAVCRACYIHPEVIDAYSQGRLAVEGSTEGRPFELAVLRFLDRARRAVLKDLPAARPPAARASHPAPAPG
jgi:DNA topoisomerase I